MGVALARRREDQVALRALDEGLSVVLRSQVLGEVAFDVKTLLAARRGARQGFVLCFPAKRSVRRKRWEWNANLHAYWLTVVLHRMVRD